MKWEIEHLFHGKLSQEYSYQKLIKSVNPSLSYNRKCSEFFFETQCIFVYLTSVLSSLKVFLL